LKSEKVSGVLPHQILLPDSVEAKDRILAGAAELFMRYGCKSVTMDDIARHLAVSKKTIYQFFRDKDEVVSTFAWNQFDCEKGCMKEIMETAKDAVDETMLISRHMRETFSKINPSLLYDMQKYHAKAWEAYADYKQSFVADHIRNNLRRGVAEGLYREDIDVEILARLRLEMIQMALDPRIFPPSRFAIIDIQMQMMELFVRGIATKKGFDLLNHYKTIYSTLQQS
jgi:AcrR family transcriptional regulator